MAYDSDVSPWPQWKGLRESLQETIDFPHEVDGFPVTLEVQDLKKNVLMKIRRKWIKKVRPYKIVKNTGIIYPFLCHFRQGLRK